MIAEAAELVRKNLGAQAAVVTVRHVSRRNATKMIGGFGEQLGPPKIQIAVRIKVPGKPQPLKKLKDYGRPY